MKTLLVSYDLRTPGKDYQRLWDKLRSFHDYKKPLESFWLIKTPLSYEEAYNEIKPYIDSSDRLMVIDVAGDSAMWSSSVGNETTQWIKDNL